MVGYVNHTVVWLLLLLTSIAAYYKPKQDLTTKVFVNPVDNIHFFTREEKPEPEHKYKILILGIETRPMQETVDSFREYSYATLGPLINNYYAQRKGYDYLRISFKQDEIPDGRIHSWAKIPIVSSKLLEGKYDYIWFLDSDAFVRNWSFSVTELIHDTGLHDNKHLLFTENCCDQDLVNGGIFIARNSKPALHMLAEWWHIPLTYPSFARYKTEHTWEQRCLAPVIDKHTTEIAIKKPMHYMNGPFGENVRHIWSDQPDRDDQLSDSMAMVLLQQLEEEVFGKNGLNLVL